MPTEFFNVGFTGGHSQRIDYAVSKTGKIKILKKSCTCYHGSNINVENPQCWHMKSAMNLLKKRIQKRNGSK